MFEWHIWNVRRSKVTGLGCFRAHRLPLLLTTVTACGSSSAMCVCVTEDLANYPATELVTQKIDKKCKPGFGLVFDGSDFLIIAFQTAVTAVKRQQILCYHISQHVRAGICP